MSNHLAIATVSATLAHMLRDPVRADVNGADIWTERPDRDFREGDGPEVRIFLYAVQPNAAWRNEDLPLRRSNGNLANRPQAALDLYYLLSFFGDERSLEPQRLLGSVVRLLHTRPILSRDEIRRMILSDPASPLSTTDLAEQTDIVRFTPLPLDLDEMSKLWSVFFQTAYRLSIAYQASVVLINPDDSPRPTLPVHDPRIVVTTIRRPTIERVVSVTGLLDPVTVGTDVHIQGSQLRGDITAVWFGATRVDPPLNDVTDEEITVTVPGATRAGMIGVRVEHRRLLGEPPTERAAGGSNISPLILRPLIAQDAGDNYLVDADGIVATGNLRRGNLNVTVEPPAGSRQRVVVHLNQVNPAAGQEPATFSLPAESRDLPGAPDETAALTIPFQNVPAGTYLVRISVDGAESPLGRDMDENSPTFEQLVAPRVVIP